MPAAIGARAAGSRWIPSIRDRSRRSRRERPPRSGQSIQWVSACRARQEEGQPQERNGGSLPRAAVKINGLQQQIPIQEN